MRKRRIFKVLMCGLFATLNVVHVSALEQNVSSNAELVGCIEGADKCVVTDNFTATKVVINKKNVTIDLNGKILTSYIVLENNANLTIVDSKGNGVLTNNARTVDVLGGSKLVLQSGVINSGNQAITVGGSSFVMNGGKVTAQEMGVVYFDKSNVEINDGIIETKDNCAIGDNGSAGRGGSVVTVNGGQLISNIVSAGYISCGIYNSNDTTLTVKAGTKIVANKGGAGIVIRGGKVVVDSQVIQDMVTGTSEGKVGDSRVIVSGKLVKDYYSGYPAKDTMDVQINYNTVENENGNVINSDLSSEKIKLLNEEIKKIINENQIPELKNVDLTKVSIEAAISTLDETEKKDAILKVNDYVKNFTIGEVFNIDILIKNDGNLVKSLIETSNKIPFQINVEDFVKNNKLNYEFQVIRYHINNDGVEEIEVLDSTYDSKNKLVSFESDQFSVFLVNYKTSEKEVSNPKTFDGVVFYALLLLVSLVGIGTLRKQKLINK